MKKLALTFAAAAVTFAFAAPVSAQDVKVRVGAEESHPAHHIFHRARARHVVIVRHDRGWHRGWEHQRAKKIVIRQRSY